MAVAIFVALLCGLISGLGIGGGSILMVWLTAVLAIEQRTAQGINLLFFLPTALASLFFHMKNRFVDFHAAIPAAIAGALTACAGAFLAQRMDTGLLRKLFGVLLIVTGALELRKAIKK